jgi:hypothetical protein
MVGRNAADGIATCEAVRSNIRSQLKEEDDV